METGRSKIKMTSFEQIIGKVFSSDATDVTFLFRGNENEINPIRAHKKYLSGVSPVFEAMFNGNWIEKDSVTVEDVDYDVFSEFIRYIYGGEIEIHEGNVVDLLNLAKKYLIGEMLSKLTTFLAENLSVENVTFSLDLAVTYDLAELNDECKRTIIEKTAEVFEAEGFLCCNIDTLEAILLLEQVSCTEAEVFDSCIKWAERKCENEEIEVTAANLLKHLGKCFDLIRFKEMNSEDFIQRSGLYGANLFTVNHLHELMTHFIKKQESLNKRQRKIPDLSPIEMRFFCHDRVLKKFPDEATCSINFSVSKPVLFTAYEMSNVFFETTDGKIPTSFNRTYQLKKCDEIVWTYSEDTTLKWNFIFFSLNKKVANIIEAGLMYEFTVKITPKTKELGKMVYAYEDMKSQTVNGLELTVHEKHRSPFELQFIYELRFEKFSNLEQIE